MQFDHLLVEAVIIHIFLGWGEGIIYMVFCFVADLYCFDLANYTQ